MTMSRTLILAAVAALAWAAPADAQRRGARQAPPPEPAAPPFFACRTAEEVCFLGIVAGSQLVVLYTNAPGAEPGQTPVDVAGADGNKIDLSKDNGRVVMMTGALDAKGGISRADVIETASPLVSLQIKAQLLGEGEESKGGGRGGPARRR